MRELLKDLLHTNLGLGGVAVVAIALLDWVGRMQAAMSVFGYLAEFLKQPYASPIILCVGLVMIAISIAQRFPHETEFRRQLSVLTLLDKIALRICIDRHGVSDAHLNEYLRENGIRSESGSVLGEVSNKTTLLERSYEGQWAVKPAFAKNLDVTLPRF